MTCSVSQAVEQRMSVRAFVDRPVNQAVVAEILERAGRSPSAGNLQPWTVCVAGGDAIGALKRDIAGKLADDDGGDVPEFSSYPPGLWEPLRTRRFLAGKLRYEAFGFDNKDPAGLLDLQRRNYDFFGAPVGLFFFMDKRVGAPQWADLGMYIMAVMLLAVERGLDTCPQHSWGRWHSTVKAFFSVPGDQMLFCGMSMGYREGTHACVSARTERAPVSSFTKYAW